MEGAEHRQQKGGAAEICAAHCLQILIVDRSSSSAVVPPHPGSPSRFSLRETRERVLLRRSPLLPHPLFVSLLVLSVLKYL